MAKQKTEQPTQTIDVALKPMTRTVKTPAGPVKEPIGQFEVIVNETRVGYLLDSAKAVPLNFIRRYPEAFVKLVIQSIKSQGRKVSKTSQPAAKRS